VVQIKISEDCKTPIIYAVDDFTIEVLMSPNTDLGQLLAINNSHLGSLVSTQIMTLFENDDTERTFVTQDSAILIRPKLKSV
jgi:hypothetical protein